MEEIPDGLHRWSRYVRAQDIAWFVVFSALAVFGPERSPEAITLLAVLAIFQVVETKIPVFDSRTGNIISILIKLGCCYLLMKFTGGVSSSYFLILLLPVIAAATTLGVLGAMAFALLACGSYISFLLLLDWEHQYIPADQWRELSLRAIILPVVGFLTHQLAEANRIEARRYQATAEQLADANRHLQEAEAAIRRSERLAALGQLTAGLAHELRNPLGTMKTSAELLLKNVAGENAVSRELADYISAEVDRTNSLITRFLEFARPLRPRLDETDLHAVIDRAVAEVERRQPPLNVAIYKNYSLDIRPFLLDGELMQRVFHNLLLNAAQASRPQGTVTVKTRLVDGDAEVAVIDRGAGIDPKNLESIFNPFFTTKSEGVGLGLAIVSKIVDEHGGKMTVESEPGQGSIFRVFLPVRTKADETSDPRYRR